MLWVTLREPLPWGLGASVGCAAGASRMSEAIVGAFELVAGGLPSCEDSELSSERVISICSPSPSLRGRVALWPVFACRVGQVAPGRAPPPGPAGGL